jgi:hypothetical protein
MIARFIKNVNVFSVQKGADLNLLAQGGQLYCESFPFSNASMLSIPYVLAFQIGSQRGIITSKQFKLCQGDTMA